MASSSGAQYLPGGGVGAYPQWPGIYFGYIAVNQDPLDQGRVKLRIPQVFGNTTSGWAAPNVPVTFIPKVGTQVTVMFVGGDPTQPVWFGNFAVVGSGNTSTGTGPPNPDPEPKPAIGSIYFQVDGGGNIIAMFEWNGAGYVDYFLAGSSITPGTNITSPNVLGGTVQGADIISDGTNGGFFGYSGLPALNNIVSAITGEALTDAEGNAIPAGITSWVRTPGSDTYFMTLNDQTVPGLFGFGSALSFNDETNPMNAPGLVAFSGQGSGGTVPGGTITISSGKGGSGDSPAQIFLTSKQRSIATGEATVTIPNAVVITGSGNPTLQINGNNAGDNMFGVDVTGDSNNRVKMDTNGMLQWGSGSAGQDTRLYRSAVNTLAADTIVANVSGNVAETWHSLGALKNSSGGSVGTLAAARYRMMPDGTVHMHIDVSFTSAAQDTFTFTNSLPAAYQPVSTGTDVRVPMAQTAAGDPLSRVFVGVAGGANAGKVEIASIGTGGTYTGTISAQVRYSVI